LEVVGAEDRGEDGENQQSPSVAAPRIFSERSSRDKTIHAVSPLAARTRHLSFSTTKQPENTRRFFGAGGCAPRLLSRSSSIKEDERAMEIKSPAVGKVLRLSVESGAQVARGDEVMVIESMKVEIPVKALTAGRIAEFRVKPGDQIQRNVVLAILDV
jgi:biotin carboxyl carrier protein